MKWSLPQDPVLGDGSPGSGVAVTEVRFRVGSDPYSAWLTEESTSGNNADNQPEVTDGDLAFFGGDTGDVVNVQVRSTDAVGNVSQIASGTVELQTQIEDPVIEDLAAKSYMEEFGASETVARAWMRVQDRSDNLSSTDLSDALPNAYGGVWLDNDDRRVKVGVVNGHSASDAEQVVEDAGLAGETDIVGVAHTQRQLEEAQIALTDELADVRAAGLVTIGRDVANNRLEIEVSTTATAAQRATVNDAADAAPVEVRVITPGWSPDDFEFQGCNNEGVYYCDGALRGGVGIGKRDGPDSRYKWGCTAAFNVYTEPGLGQRILTAGHCMESSPVTWYTLGTFRRNDYKIGLSVANRRLDLRGDIGTIQIDNDSPYRPFHLRAPVVLVEPSRSGAGNTTLNTNYAIREVGASRAGRTVCRTGSNTGSSCHRIEKVGDSYIVDGIELGSMGKATGGKCTEGGDSGGPYYKRGQAMGVHSGTARIGSRCWMYYTGASVAQNQLGIRISTRK